MHATCVPSHPEAAHHTQRLWFVLKALAEQEVFRRIFNETMHSMNLYPLNVGQARAHAFTYGMMVETLGIQAEDAVHVSESPAVTTLCDVM